MKLIDDWKQVWKWYSTHAMVIYMALVSYYVSLEPTVKEQIPNWMLYAGIVTGKQIGRASCRERV